MCSDQYDSELATRNNPNVAGRQMKQKSWFPEASSWMPKVAGRRWRLLRLTLLHTTQVSASNEALIILRHMTDLVQSCSHGW